MVLIVPRGNLEGRPKDLGAHKLRHCGYRLRLADDDVVAVLLGLRATRILLQTRGCSRRWVRLWGGRCCATREALSTKLNHLDQR